MKKVHAMITWEQIDHLTRSFTKRNSDYSDFEFQLPGEFTRSGFRPAPRGTAGGNSPVALLMTGESALRAPREVSLTPQETS